MADESTTNTVTTQLRRPTFRELCANRSFRALLGVTTTNVLGTSLQILALSVLVYTSTGSALWSSTAFAAGFLPQLLGGALLTSLADRLPTRRLLAGGSLLRAALAAVLAVADLPPGVAVGLVAAVATVSPVPSAAQAALVVRLLPGELYVLGRSVFSLMSSGAQLAGLAVGGTVVGLLGARTALGAAAVIQLMGLVGVAVLPDTGRATPHRSRWRPADTWRGNTELLAVPAVRRILLSWWVPITLLVGAESLVVAYVAESGEPTWATGVLLAAFPVGSGVGDLVVGRWCPPELRARLVPWLLGSMGAGLVPFGAHPALAAGVAALVGASASTAYQLGGQRAFLDAVPVDRHGLALGLVNTGVQTGQGVGPVVAGAVAQCAGVGVTISLLGVGIVLVAVLLGRLPGHGGAGPAARLA